MQFHLPLKYSYIMLSRRAKILDLFVSAHHAGLHHLDFAERNVVQKDGEYRLIDLRHARKHSSACRWTYSFGRHVDCKTPRIDDPSIGCWAIWEQAREMEFWEIGECTQSIAARLTDISDFVRRSVPQSTYPRTKEQRVPHSAHHKQVESSSMLRCSRSLSP